MDGVLLVIRFFRVLPPVPLPMFGALGLATLAALTAVVLRRGDAAAVLAPIVLVQVLAASSGVVVPARRGHYDLLLTAGADRRAIAAVHWGMSAGPGLLAWLLVAAADAIVRGSAATPLTSSGTVVAMALVSTIPWAATVASPPRAGGIAWLVLLAVTLPLAPAAAWTTWPAALVCPWLLLGRVLSADDAALIGAATVAMTATMTLACVWITRMDVPLGAAR